MKLPDLTNPYSPNRQLQFEAWQAAISAMMPEVEKLKDEIATLKYEREGLINLLESRIEVSTRYLTPHRSFVGELARGRKEAFELIKSRLTQPQKQEGGSDENK